MSGFLVLSVVITLYLLTSVIPCAARIYIADMVVPEFGSGCMIDIFSKQVFQ